MHTGVAELRDGDYFGAAVNRAARIMSVAHGEQVLLSAATAELVRGRLPEGVTLREMGEHRLKGLLNPERLLQVVAPDLRADFPPLASLNGTQPAGRARCLRGSARAVGRAGAPPGRRGAPRLGPGHRRHRQDAAGHPVRLEFARRLPGRRLVLRSVAGPKPGWHRPRRCAGARRAAGQGRPGDPDWARDRGARTVSRDPRQLRAGRAPRGGNAGPVAQSRERCAVPGDDARSAGAARRRGPRAGAAGAVRRGGAVPAQSRGGEAGIPAECRRSVGDRPAREAAGGPAAGDRAGRGAGAGDAPADAAPAHERAVQAALVDRRTPGPAGDAARGVRLVLGPAVVARESRAGPTVGVRGWIHARVRGGDPRPVRVRERAVAHGRAAIAGAQVTGQAGDRRSLRSPRERAGVCSGASAHRRRATPGAVRPRCSRRKRDTARTLPVWTRRRRSPMAAPSSTISSWPVAGPPREATPTWPRTRWRAPGRG